jgi:hypothetical protein
MSALAVGGIVFGCVFGGALLGMFLNAVLGSTTWTPNQRMLSRWLWP